LAFCPFAAALDRAERRRAGPICLDRGKEGRRPKLPGNCWIEGRGPTIGQYRTVVKAVQSSVVGVKASRAVGGKDNDELSGFLIARAGSRGRTEVRDLRKATLESTLAPLFKTLAEVFVAKQPEDVSGLL